MFYFYTMYSEVADDNFFEIQKDLLLTWHENDPVNDNEIESGFKSNSVEKNNLSGGMYESGLFSVRLSPRVIDKLP